VAWFIEAFTSSRISAVCDQGRVGMAVEEEEDVESCGSRAVESYSAIANPPSRHHHQRQKLEVYNEVLKRIQDSNFEETNLPGFDDNLWLHFNRLPAR
jgi:hypothetical protein